MRKGKSQGLYMISIASELIGVHPQTLRLYEKLGLIKPSRSKGRVRLYSDEDIEKIRQIQRLTQEVGVNLAGVEVILNMIDKMETMRSQMEEEIRRMKEEMEYEFKRMAEIFQKNG